MLFNSAVKELGKRYHLPLGAAKAALDASMKKGRNVDWAFAAACLALANDNDIFTSAEVAPLLGGNADTARKILGTDRISAGKFKAYCQRYANLKKKF